MNLHPGWVAPPSVNAPRYPSTPQNTSGDHPTHSGYPPDVQNYPSNPQNTPGCPPNALGFPPNVSGCPPNLQKTPAYLPQPPNNQSYAQNLPGYPQNASGYPQNAPGYPQNAPAYLQGFPQSVAGYPANPGYPQQVQVPGYPQVNGQAHPSPVGTYQENAPIVTMPVPIHDKTFEQFEKKKAIGYSIVLIVFGCLQLIFNAVTSNIFNGFSGIPAVVAGVLGILSSKQPSKGKIVAFMVFIIIGIIITILDILSFIFSNFMNDDNDLYCNICYEMIVGYVGLLLDGAVVIISIYCANLARRVVGCCGCNSQNLEIQGEVHGKVCQPVSNVENPVLFQTAPAQPPSYSQAIESQEA